MSLGFKRLIFNTDSGRCPPSR